MVLELHIWGPAFGLPSIDAQSLATVAYFVQCVPLSEWWLIPSSDPSISPAGELPTLRSGSTWICGFNRIIKFLRNTSSGEWDLDRDLSGEQRADSIAFSSFLESRGQPLLDLCLYVSSENYTAWTRPALAQILQWPHQWVIPHQLRNNAKIRSEHLGLSSLDIETASEEDGNSNTRGAGNIPKNLVTKPKETVKSMLGKTGHQHQFRLAAVTSDFLEPLQDLVQKNGSHSWVFGTDRASSLDCLILGYMSLANPPLPPPYKWLQNALSARYSELFQWTTNFRQECFGGPINTVDVLHASMTDLPSGQNKLPWRSSAPISAMNIGLTIFRATFDALPLVSTYRPDRIVRDSGDTAGASSALVKTTQYPTYNGLGLAGSALGAAIGYFLYMGAFSSSRRTHHDHVFCSRRNNTSQRDFGEAGRMLGLAAL